MSATDHNAADLERRYEDRPTLCTRITTTDDGNTECTIYPDEASIQERSSQWITASEGSYVDVEACR